jgi:hypothetical protein
MVFSGEQIVEQTCISAFLQPYIEALMEAVGAYHLPQLKGVDCA